MPARRSGGAVIVFPQPARRATCPSTICRCDWGSIPGTSICACFRSHSIAASVRIRHSTDTSKRITAKTPSGISPGSPRNHTTASVSLLGGTCDEVPTDRTSRIRNPVHDRTPQTGKMLAQFACGHNRCCAFHRLRPRQAEAHRALCQSPLDAMLLADRPGTRSGAPCFVTLDQSEA
jgi:hypothetical protein